MSSWRTRVTRSCYVFAGNSYELTPLTSRPPRHPFRVTALGPRRGRSTPKEGGVSGSNTNRVGEAGAYDDLTHAGEGGESHRTGHHEEVPPGRIPGLERVRFADAQDVIPDPGQEAGPRPPSDEPTVHASTCTEYVIDRLVRMGWDDAGREMLRTRWYGFEANANTWEYADNLQVNLVNAYRDKFHLPPGWETPMNPAGTNARHLYL